MKIMLAMATYNRLEQLKQCILSLSQIDLLDEIDVFIFDDKSTEYDEGILKEIVPFAKKIIVRENNLKADRNMYQIHCDFLSEDYDYLFQIDSDMLFSNKIISIVKKVISNSGNAVYSFYNSSNHDIYSEEYVQIEDVIFCHKKSIGGACVVFPRKILENVISNFKAINDDFSCYDYRWSEILMSQNIPILVSKESYVQHIGGLNGQNNNGISGLDIGINFIPTNTKDLEFILNYYENIIINYNQHNRDNIFIKKSKIPKLLFSIRKLIKEMVFYIKGEDNDATQHNKN